MNFGIFLIPLVCSRINRMKLFKRHHASSKQKIKQRLMISQSEVKKISKKLEYKLYYYNFWNYFIFYFQARHNVHELIEHPFRFNFCNESVCRRCVDVYDYDGLGAVKVLCHHILPLHGCCSKYYPVPLGPSFSDF